MTSVDNGQFYGNILVVGRTNCGEATFIEKLGLNNFFGDIIKTEWMSGIDIDKQREAEIQSYLKMRPKFILLRNKINLTL